MTHDHVWGLLRQWRELGVTPVAAADPSRELRERVSKEGVPRTYDDYHDMLAKEDLDIVMVCLDNAHHADVVEAAAAAGAHCLVEKPMAATFDQADRMVKAVERRGVKLMVNWPTTWMPIYRTASELVSGGAIGRVIQVKHLGGHAGPRAIGCSQHFYSWLYDRALNGAGAYMDYSGYRTNIVY